MPVKLIVAGSRGFADYRSLCDAIDDLDLYIDLIISGTAKGADQMGERYAREHGIPVIRMPADWATHGKSAGYKRNEEMAKAATHCIVFWDGKSRGTKHMINLAKKYNLEFTVVS